MERLVYSPKVFAFIRTHGHGIVDVSPYIVSGNVSRKVNQVSSAELVLRNPSKKFTQPGNPYFHPMDPITIFLERVPNIPVQTFTGYLDSSPYLQLFPGTCQLAASCTLKKLQYTYWDPALPYTMQYLAQFGWIPNPATGQILNPSAEKWLSKDTGIPQDQIQIYDGGDGKNRSSGSTGDGAGSGGTLKGGKWETVFRQYSGSSYGIDYINSLYATSPSKGHVHGDKDMTMKASRRYGVPFNLLWGVYGAESSWGKAESWFGLTGDHPGTGTSGDFQKDAYRSAEIIKRLYKESGGHSTGTADAQPSVSDASSSSTATLPELTTDSSIGDLLQHVITDIGRWDPKDVYIEPLPKDIPNRVAKIFLSFEAEDKNVQKALQKFFEHAIGSNGSGGSGGSGPGGNPKSKDGIYSMKDLVILASQVGWKGDEVPIAAAIAMAESSGDPKNKSYNPGSVDRGLWQLNSYWEKDVDDKCAYDPVCNAKAAYKHYKKSGWTPTWVTYTRKIYLKFLPDAKRAWKEVQNDPNAS